MTTQAVDAASLIDPGLAVHQLNGLSGADADAVLAGRASRGDDLRSQDELAGDIRIKERWQAAPKEGRCGQRMTEIPDFDLFNPFPDYLDPANIANPKASGLRLGYRKNVHRIIAHDVRSNRVHRDGVRP